MTINPKSLAHYKQKLIDQQSHFEKAMIAAVEHGRDAAATDTQDPADLAVSSYQKELAFSQSSNEHSQLGLVRLALERVEDGTFGECAHCGKTIGEKRLEALPWTPYCIDCQEKIENGDLEPALRVA